VAVVTVLAERLMKLLKKKDRKIEERIVREVFDGAMSGRLIKLAIIRRIINLRMVRIPRTGV
jgi:hypothetical protein